LSLRHIRHESRTRGIEGTHAFRVSEVSSSTIAESPFRSDQGRRVEPPPHALGVPRRVVQGSSLRESIVNVPCSGSRSRAARAAGALLGFLLPAPAIAFAQTPYTWNKTGSASWATSTDWTPTRSSPATTDILVIDGSITPLPTLTAIPTQT